MDDLDEDTKAIMKTFEAVAKKGLDTLDLNVNGIQNIPQGLSRLNLPHLKYFYLEGNKISFLPEEFFLCLHSLEWLDLRNNKLQDIPRNIGEHKNIKTLLLGRNQLTFLPLELGVIRTLTGLNLSNNPLKEPPQTVINKGVHAIKHYLLAKLGFNPEDFQSDETESEYQSTESGSDSSQIECEERKNDSKEGRDGLQKDSDGKRKDDNEGSILHAGIIHNEGDQATTQVVCSREALSYYGALLGDIPKSYIFKPWKTGVFFKKEEMTNLSLENFDQDDGKGQ